MVTTKQKSKVEIIFVVVTIVLYIIAASLVSLNRFWQYNAFWYDFGIFDETVFKLSRFQLPIIPNLNPPNGKIVWADHFNPSAIMLVPFYWLTQKAEIILVVQALFVSLSAGIAYLISLQTIKSRVVRISLLSSYLGFVGVQNALYTDVHNIVFALLPLTATIWAIYQKSWSLYFLFLFITLGFQENLAAVGVGLGLFLLVRRERNIKIGLLTIILSILYGLITFNIIIPYFRGNSYAYQPDIPKVWYEWITGFIFPIDLKLRSMFLTFATFGFLPLFSIPVIPLIIEHYLERFVLNQAATRWDLGFHYNVLLSAIMFLASIEVVKKLQNNKRLKHFLPFWSITTIIIVIFLHRFYLHGPLMLATHPVFYQDTKKAEFLRTFVSNIPREGLLMTQNNLAAHFTHRKIVLLNKNIEAIKPDVVAIDIRDGQNANNFFPLTYQQAQDLVASLSVNKSYNKKEVTSNQLIFTLND